MTPETFVKRWIVNRSIRSNYLGRKVIMVDLYHNYIFKKGILWGWLQTEVFLVCIIKFRLLDKASCIVETFINKISCLLNKLKMQRLTSRRPTGGSKNVVLKKQQSREIAGINVANKENVSNVVFGVVDNGDKAFDVEECEMQINTVQALEDENDDDESTKRNKRIEFYCKELEKEEER
jgi:hypothetical protein